MRRKNREFEEEIHAMQRETHAKQLAAEKALNIKTKDEYTTRQEESEKKKLVEHMKGSEEESRSKEYDLKWRGFDTVDRMRNDIER